MSEKLIQAECESCESSFEMSYEEDYVSGETPSFCPFCGEKIEVIEEDFIDVDDSDENGVWR